MMTDALSYIRQRLAKLGYKEWREGFDFANIPETVLNTSFGVQMGDVRGVSNNMRVQISEVPLVVFLWRAPAKDAKAVMDEAILAGETAVKDLIKTKNCTLFPGIKTVAFNAMRVDKIARNNQIGVTTRIDVTAMVLFQTDQ